MQGKQGNFSFSTLIDGNWVRSQGPDLLRGLEEMGELVGCDLQGLYHFGRRTDDPVDAALVPDVRNPQIVTVGRAGAGHGAATRNSALVAHAGHDWTELTAICGRVADLPRLVSARLGVEEAEFKTRFNRVRRQCPTAPMSFVHDGRMAVIRDGGIPLAAAIAMQRQFRGGLVDPYLTARRREPAGRWTDALRRAFEHASVLRRPSDPTELLVVCAAGECLTDLPDEGDLPASVTLRYGRTAKELAMFATLTASAACEQVAATFGVDAAVIRTALAGGRRVKVVGVEVAAGIAILDLPES
jgi:hypothetical protein